MLSSVAPCGFKLWLVLRISLLCGWCRGSCVQLGDIRSSSSCIFHDTIRSHQHKNEWMVLQQERNERMRPAKRPSDQQCRTDREYLFMTLLCITSDAGMFLSISLRSPSLWFYDPGTASGLAQADPWERGVAQYPDYQLVAVQRVACKRHSRHDQSTMKPLLRPFACMYGIVHSASYRNPICYYPSLCCHYTNPMSIQQRASGWQRRMRRPLSVFDLYL